MRTLNELETLVKNLDGGSLSSIKVLRDRFDIENGNVLTVEKVPKRAHDRGRIAITVRNDYPDWIVGDPIGVLALSHYITKKVAKSLKDIHWLKPYKPSNAVLERNVTTIRRREITVRVEFETPKRGSKINGKALEKALVERIPILADSLRWHTLNRVERESIKNLISSINDQRHIIKVLREEDCIAFIGNGANPDPEHGARPISISRDLLSTIELPSGRVVEGLIIRRGITSFYGEKYAGKTTLLMAIARGFYVFQPGDGREWIKSVDAIPIISSDLGRVIRGVDVSPYLQEHPSLEISVSDARTYSSDSYLSQVASLMEAMELRSPAVIIDEEYADPYFIRGKGNGCRTLPQTIVALSDKYNLSLILGVETSEELLKKSYVVYRMSKFEVVDKVTFSEEPRVEDMEIPRPRSRRPPQDFIPEIRDYKVGDRKIRISSGKRSYSIIMDRLFRMTILEKGQLSAAVEAIKLVRDRLDGKRSLTSAIKDAMNTLFERGISYLGYRAYYAEFSEWHLAYLINRISKIR